MISEAFASSKGLFTFTYEKCFFCRTTQLGAFLIVSNDPKLCRTAQIQSHDQFCVNRPFKKQTTTYFMKQIIFVIEAFYKCKLTFDRSTTPTSPCCTRTTQSTTIPIKTHTGTNNIKPKYTFIEL
jgi:hypothetical protein